MDMTALMSMFGGSSGQSLGKGVDFLMSMAGSGARNDLVKAHNAHNKAMDALRTKVRDKNNEQVAAWDATKRWQQAENNKRTLQGAGEAVTANTINARRRSDSQDLGELSTRIAVMEQRGAAYAAQAASGVVGTVGDMVNSTIRLRQAMDKEQLKRNRLSESIDVAIRSGDIMRQAVTSLDQTYIHSNFDNTVFYTPQQMTEGMFSRVWNAAGGSQGMVDMGKGIYSAGKQMWTAFNQPTKTEQVP